MPGVVQRRSEGGDGRNSRRSYAVSASQSVSTRAVQAPRRAHCGAALRESECLKRRVNCLGLFCVPSYLAKITNLYTLTNPQRFSRPPFFTCGSTLPLIPSSFPISMKLGILEAVSPIGKILFVVSASRGPLALGHGSAVNHGDTHGQWALGPWNRLLQTSSRGRPRRSEVGRAE